ncbi:DEAD-box ATP-dependent RNA helicase 31 [Citrus sinensis]|uniref:DEAD-box ATP-dependent RNA helicase 31 n=1 Tax=Citrus sinensis TaxID=2711 RepID=A0ACB8MPF1_CITSI|nr:DEAD-box ATP-dependent RNA helicase 31 [Citrus sinensis]KAH9787530.1 DEAD-box ATP-dependent RNA helicase 31 [Citrus sinensis]
MNLKPSVNSSRAIPAFRRIFPFKLKYLGLPTRVNSQQQQQQQLGLRKLSTRPFRPAASSEFGRRGSRAGEIRGSKNLIDDEAELSDWVSDLRTDSFHSNKRFSKDDDVSDFRKGSGRENRGSYSMKRRRKSDSDDSYDSSRRGNRNSVNSFSRNNISNNTSRFSRRSNSELEAGNVGRKTRFSNDDENDVGEERRRGMSGIRDLLSEEVSDNDDDDDDSVLRNNARSLIGLDKENGGMSVAISSPGKHDSFMSESRFDQCSISALSLKGIKDAGYEKMTIVQEATLPVLLKGKDVLAKAKTGTGKTVAFLLPSIEVVIKSPPVDRDQKRPPILVLVICPTRELATQAATEASTLLKYHPSIGVQVVIGVVDQSETGSSTAYMNVVSTPANICTGDSWAMFVFSRIQNSQILVATPGRLRDHIENTAGFATRLMGVKVLVLDEADHLLDMGFRKDIEKIIAAVPKQRQTLLFSATVPEEVRQMHLVAPLDLHFPLLYVLLREHVADNPEYKVLVFCTTAMVTRMVADLLGELKLNVREIHSRKPQSYRTRVSDEFRKSKGLILVTSDVSARGVDYPDVTLVIQVGLPSDREQYIHRLGRTGRKGKEGQGILLLAPWEEFFLSTIKDLPILKAPVPSVDPDTKKKVERALSHVEMKNKEAAYQAWLGYYNSNKKVGRDKYKLVELANEYSRSMGLDNPPAIPKLVLGKMGLRNIPGLRSK